MHAEHSPLPPPRRRCWPWLLAILLTPFAVLAVAAANYLTLNRDAALLRREVMAATDTPWDTKVQLSAGRFTFGVLRSCLAFVHDEKFDEARAALATVRSASVGVYRRRDPQATWSREQLFNETDREMRRRGWSRLVGVTDKFQHVLVYAPADGAEVGQLCLAVVNPRELVVVSALVDPEAISALVARQLAKHAKPSPWSRHSIPL